MSGPPAKTVTLTAQQRDILESFDRASSTSQRLAERSRVVLLANEGTSNEGIGRALGVDRQMVRRWRSRWADAEERLLEAENEEATDKDLRNLVVDVLSDAERCGVPCKFTPEEVTAIIALACEPPSDSGLPVSHWTPPELAREAIKRGIVESISPRQVDRFLARRVFGPTSRSIG